MALIIAGTLLIFLIVSMLLVRLVDRETSAESCGRSYSNASLFSRGSDASVEATAISKRRLMTMPITSNVTPTVWRAVAHWLRSRGRRLSKNSRQAKCFLSTLVLLTAWSSVAAAQKVKVGYDRTADFSKYATYTWAPPGVPSTRPLLYLQVVGTIDEHLRSKGLRRIEQGGDLILAALGGVDFGVNVPVGTPILPSYSGPPPSIDSGMWIGAGGFSGGAAPLVPEGTLQLEFVDQRANKVVWSGSVSEKFDSDKKNESLRRLDKAISKLLNEFPPEKKK